MLPSDVDQYRVIDTDTHVIEPYDLWTSRLSVDKWGDKVPHVQWDERHQEDAWYFGDRAGRCRGIGGAGRLERVPAEPPAYALRGRSRHLGRRPPPRPHGRLRDLGASAVSERGRLRRRQGARHRRSRAHARLRPGVQRLPDRLRLGRSQAPHPDRRPPVLGHGLDGQGARPVRRRRPQGRDHDRRAGRTGACPSSPTRTGIPLWAAAQDAGLSINFHIGSGDMSIFDTAYEGAGPHANYAGFGCAVRHGQRQGDRQPDHAAACATASRT